MVALDPQDTTKAYESRTRARLETAWVGEVSNRQKRFGVSKAYGRIHESTRRSVESCPLPRGFRPRTRLETVHRSYPEEQPLGRSPQAVPLGTAESSAVQTEGAPLPGSSLFATRAVRPGGGSGLVEADATPRRPNSSTRL